MMLNGPRVSVPLVHLVPKIAKKEKHHVVVFSHGNGADLSHSLSFVCSMACNFEAEYVAYDYSGYGRSEIKETTPDSICNDLEAVLAWLDRPLSEIILVGFSLGCYPTAKVASKHKVKGVVLLSPMMSLISLMADERKLGVNSFFKNDEFNTF
jgi:abhydrolase domain-containing protein 17